MPRNMLGRLRDATAGARADPRLERIAHRLAVPIEVAAGRPPVDDVATYTWRDYKKLLWTGKRTTEEAREPDDGSAPIDEAFLREEHRRQYGRPWLLGRYVFDFVRSRGLHREDALLDVGCGALRFGVHAVDYLAAGRYFGVDAHLKSLEAASSYEVRVHDLVAKTPRLLWNESFDFGHFGMVFDWVLDFSTSCHVPEADLPLFFERATAVLAPGGRMLASPEPRLSRSALGRLGLRLVHHEVQDCPLLAGHGFEHRNDWFEYRRA